MDKTEYMYYSDIIGYIAENDQSTNAQILLKKSRYHLKKLSKLIDHDRDFLALKSLLFDYKANSNINDNVLVPTKIYEQNEYGRGTSAQYGWEGKEYDGFVDAINLV